MGVGQVALAHPEFRKETASSWSTASTNFLTKRVRGFDANLGQRPLSSLNTNQGHVAYLGYLDPCSASSTAEPRLAL
jgi:hypothetical protein